MLSRMHLIAMPLLGSMFVLPACETSTSSGGAGSGSNTNSSSSSSGTGGSATSSSSSGAGMGGAGGSETSSSSSGAGMGGAGGSSAKDYTNDAVYCEALANRQALCTGAVIDPAKIAQCTKSVACEWNTYRADLILGKRTCMADTACADSVNACVNAVYAGLMDTPVTSAFRAMCDVRNAECSMAGKGFAADTCQDAILRNDDMSAKMSDCLAKPCDMISLCLYDVAWAAQSPCL